MIVEQPGFWLAVIQIIWIDILLSGDNAVVIALACRKLPPRQRVWGVVLGTVVAISLRVIFAGLVTFLMQMAYLKLVGVQSPQFRDRAHFLAMASRVMRRLLVDQARARRAAKRGGAAVPAELDEALYVSDSQAEAFEALDEALKRLEAIDPRQGRIVEQRYFGGLSLEETAEAMGVSLATVKRELRFARAWLAADLGAHAATSGERS